MFISLPISAIIVAIVLLYKYYSRNVNFWKDRGVKGPKPLPLLGNLLDNFKTPITELELERSRKYGKIYGFLELTQPIISVSDLDLIKLMTMKDFACFTNHADLTPGDPFLSKVLVNLNDEEWKRVRNICIPAFTMNKIRRMFPMVEKVANNTLEYFDEMALMNNPIELQKTFSSFAGDIVAHTVYGVNSNGLKNPNGEFSRMASDLFSAESPRVLLGVLLPAFVRKIIGFYIFNPQSCEYFKNLVKHIINERKDNNNLPQNLLSILLTSEVNDLKKLSELSDEGLGSADFEVKSEQRKLNEDEILATGVMMVIAGVETISTVLMYVMFVLATKPGIQNKLYEEVKKYFENEEYGFDSLMSLPYLEAVINETMRRYTPVVQFDRVANWDYELGGTGITLPKGTHVNIPYHAIHNDPDYWPEPFEFRPERFLPENKENIVPYSFAPFGYGARICLGMKLGYAEMKTVLAKIVYRFEVLKADNTPQEPIYCGKKITNHCLPLYVRVKKRSS